MLCEVLTLLRFKEAKSELIMTAFALAIFNLPNFFTVNILLYSNDTM